MDSIQVVDGERQPIVSSRSVNPCNLGKTPHELGAYDLVQCKNSGDFFTSIAKSWAPEPEALDPPDALIYDAPMVYYELRKRYDAVGSCKLKTVGPEFFASGKMIADKKHGLPWKCCTYWCIKCRLLTLLLLVAGYGIGFPKNSLYSRAFSLATQRAVANGTTALYSVQFNVSANGFPCHESFEDTGDTILLEMVAGIVIISGLVIMAGFVAGIVGENSSTFFQVFRSRIIKVGVVVGRFTCVLLAFLLLQVPHHFSTAF
jgi:hypothetical protein